MILNLGSAIFNAETSSGGGTPAWGTEMGQGDGYRFNFEDYESLITSLVYNSIPNPGTRIYCPLGKGGNQASDYEFVVASKFNKIFVNGKRVHDCSFILLVVKKLVGQNHVGRRTLKYNPRITLDNQNYNERCFELIGKTLGVSNNGSWFISEIYSKNQDELHFTAHILDENDHFTFSNSQNRSEILASKIKAYAESKEINNLKRFADNLLSDKPLQQIYYGAPGTGKSFTIDNLTDDDNSVRTTFHPDTDYASFVGAYKPTMKDMPLSAFVGKEVHRAQPQGEHPGTEQRIVYKYVPQAFLKAYVAAWRKLDTPYYLIIEEINRGNCAQIFGDLFQLLDRNNSGSSSYAINADEDIAKFLKEDVNGFASLSQELRDAIAAYELVKDNGEKRAIGGKILDGTLLLLPHNLHIWATMNTSDQSLFPIDSAFKRRWNWKYVPIDTNPINKNTNLPLNWKFEVAGNLYSWGKFLEKINPEIYTITESSDKQMGYFFAKADPTTGIISEEVFLNKVLFYLWTDVFKDYDVSSEIFKNKKENRSFRFTDFFEDTDALANFIENCGLEVLNDNSEDFDTDEQGGQTAFYNFISDGVKCRSITNAFRYILRNACEKQNIDFATIKAAVEQYIQRDEAVIKQIESADTYEKENGWNAKILTTSDNISFVVSNQWKKEFLPMVKALAEHFGVVFEEK